MDLDAKAKIKGRMDKSLGRDYMAYHYGGASSPCFFAFYSCLPNRKCTEQITHPVPLRIMFAAEATNQHTGHALDTADVET